MNVCEDPNLIRMRVVNVNELTREGVQSEVKRIDGFPWKVRVYRGRYHGRHNELNVEVHFTKSQECAVWECEKVEGEVKVVNHVDDSNSLVQNFGRTTYGYSCTNFNDTSICWKGFDVINNENFVNDGSIVVEVKLDVKGGNGDRFRKRLPIDFFSPSKYSDAILIVEGKKLHVSKQILAQASYYFESLFFGNFKDTEKNVITIKDVSFEQFMTLLELIYDTGREVDDTNSDFLVALAEPYQIWKINIFAEKELIRAAIHLEDKLLLADRYNLYGLKAKCLWDWYDNWNHWGQESLLNSEQYTHFSSELKDEIKEWIVDIEARNSENIKIKVEILKKRNVERIEKLTMKADLRSPTRFSDVILVVGDEKIHTSKQVLARASSYFENLFYGDTENSNEKEFIIDDVSPKDLLTVLEIYYDTRTQWIFNPCLNDDEVELVLKIAYRFKLADLIDRAEHSLMCGSELPLHKKLLLADQYKLEVLMMNRLDLIDSCSDIVELKNSESYKYYSSDLIKVLFEILVELCDDE